jgi:hypothetical protein
LEEKDMHSIFSLNGQFGQQRGFFAAEAPSQSCSAPHRLLLVCPGPSVSA